LGYKFIQTYYDPNLIKTDCKTEIIYEILKIFKKKEYSNDYLKNVEQNSYTYKILNKSCTVNLNPQFYEVEDLNKYPKYLPNPQDNWGPQKRSKLKKYNI
jgi:hypothetical protein